MEENQQKPWETFAGAEVAAEKPQTEAPTDSRPPHERYRGYDVVSREEAYSGDLADATAQALAQGEPYEAQEKNAGKGSDGIIDWVGDVGRATLFGPLSEPISALILSQMHKDTGLTYTGALDLVKEQNESTKSGSATLVGAFLGGGMVAAGLKRSAQWGATKSGLAKGAMQWATSNSKVRRYVAAAGAGAAAGAVEEGIRTSLEETVDATGGRGFDGERIVDNVLLGSLIGGAATPAIQGAVNGAGWFARYIKGATGSTDEQTYQATTRILREFANDDETLDQAADRFRERVQSFRAKNGRVPAAAEIMKPEQVAGAADVIRQYNGLDIRARELGEEGVERALRSYDDLITDGGNIPSPEYVEDQIERLFTDTVRRNGNVKVSVPDDTVSYMQRNEGFLKEIADNHNEGAAAMLKVVRGKNQVKDLERQVRGLGEDLENSVAFDKVNKLKVDLATMIREAVEEGAEEGTDDMANLRSLIQLEQALANKMKSATQVGRAGFKKDEVMGILRNAQADLANYSENGLRISLSDANNIRSTASRYSNSWRGAAPDKADRARAIRDAVAPIGTKEVPEYGKVVQRFNLEMNRAEAQATGIQAARGDIDLMDLQTRIRSGRLPGKPKTSRANQRYAIREGVAEGARRTLQNEVRGSAAEGVSAAARVSGSPRVQKGLRQAIGKNDAKAIKEGADSVMSTYDSLKALVNPTSASELAEERRIATEVATGAAFGSLGGAGRAALYQRIMSRFQIPRGTAKKMVEMLGNPDEIEPALRYMQRQGVQLGPLFGAIQAHITEPVSND